MRCLLFIGLGLAMLPCLAQQHHHALFLGNSYTAANNLPQIIADLAVGSGDTLSWEANTPGGYTLQLHSTNATTLSLIEEGGWDYVVLQEQSQLPGFPIAQVETEVFPFAAELDSLVLAGDPCAETVFYMTWGRKNGDAFNCPVWPPVCTYEGMDSLLRERYITMAEDNEAIVSPAGAVWRFIRETSPWLELYAPDESHPNAAGSFAAACAFYTVFFRKDPSLLPYNYTLDPVTAGTIKEAAKQVVFDSLAFWNVGEYDPVAEFTAETTMTGEVLIENNSQFSDSYFWDMGDGNTYTEETPVHTYTSSGSYLLSMVASSCGRSDTATINLLVDIATNVEEVVEANKWAVQAVQGGSALMVVHPENAEWRLQLISLSGEHIPVTRSQGSLLAIPEQVPLGIYLVLIWSEGSIELADTLVAGH